MLEVSKFSPPGQGLASVQGSNVALSMLCNCGVVHTTEFGLEAVAVEALYQSSIYLGFSGLLIIQYGF